MDTFGVKCRWRKMGAMSASTHLHRRQYMLPESVFDDVAVVTGVGSGR